MLLKLLSGFLAVLLIIQATCRAQESFPELLKRFGWYRKPNKTSPAICLPPEIIHAILLIYPSSQPLSTSDKRILSQCSLTCRHWATVLRPLLFQHLVLRSKKDIDVLLALGPPIIKLIDKVDLAVGPSRPKRPWLHRARELKQTNAAVRIIVLPNPTSWKPASSLKSSTPLKTHAKMKCAVLDTLPPSVPAWILCIAELLLYGLEITSVAVVSRLIAQLQTVRSCRCQDICFATLDSGVGLLAERHATHRDLLRPLELMSVRCTLGFADPEAYMEDHSYAVSSSVLVSVRCPPAYADEWKRTASLLSTLCSSCKCDYVKVNFVPGDGEYQAIQPSSTCNISLEASFILEDGVPAVINLLLIISSGEVKNIEEHLDWSAFSEQLEGNLFGTLFIQAYDADCAAYLHGPDDKPEQPIHRLIKSGRARVVCDKSTAHHAAANLAAGTRGSASISYKIATQLGNLRPRPVRRPLEPSHGRIPAPDRVRAGDALMVVPVLVTAAVTAGSLYQERSRKDSEAEKRVESKTEQRVRKRFLPSIEPGCCATETRYLDSKATSCSQTDPTATLALSTWIMGHDTGLEDSVQRESPRSQPRRPARIERLSAAPSPLPQLECGRSDDEVQNLPVSDPPLPQHSYLDHKDTCLGHLPGLIVPQAIYKLPGDQPRFCRSAVISFTMHGGKMGIRLADALCLPLPRLNDAKSELKPSEIGTHITLRILWPGYVLWRRKLILNDPTRKAGAMTLEQLAQRIAMQLRDFCEAKCQESPGEPDWQIVPGCFEELYLIELRHVSQGSWQPVICWDRS